MIPRAHITAWREFAPWPADAQVEQDLVLSRALVEIFNHPLLTERLAFRGGTALHKLHLAPAARYSEDIDFVQTVAEPIGPVMSAIRSTLDPWLGTPRRSQSEGRVTFMYRFASEGLPVVPLRLKVEVNTREHFSVLEPESRRFAVENDWFSGTADLATYQVEELLGTKLRALYQRKKGRDLYDLSAAVSHLPTLNLSVVVECFSRYIEHDGCSVSRAQFEANLSSKLRDRVFRSDLTAILSSEAAHEFDLDQAGRLVMERVVTLLRGEPWQGNQPRTRRL